MRRQVIGWLDEWAGGGLGFAVLEIPEPLSSIHILSHMYTHMHTYTYTHTYMYTYTYMYAHI